MPVKFEGKSEYQRCYEGGDPNNPTLPEFYRRPTQEDPKPIPSNNGVTHEPAIQHKKAVDLEPTPVPSYTVLEPPIQRKKKPVIPHGLRSAEQAQNGDEYVLLGSQEKFTPNIIYKSKGVSHSQEHKDDSKQQADVPQKADEPVTPLAPRVVVDTGAPSKTTKASNMDGHVPQKANIPKSSPPKKSNKQGPHLNGVKQGVTYKQPVPTHKEPPKQAPRQEPSPKQTAPRPVKSKEEPQNRPQTRLQEKVDAVSQANTKQAQNDANQNKKAQDDYALQYKAGIGHRPKGPKRLSEYQMQYAWKKAVGASPLLDAEQVVYKSSTQLVPAKADFAKTSEYKKQFQSWDVERSRPEKREDSDKKSRAKRSKSVGATSPDRRIPAGTQRVTSEHDPRLVQESLNPLRLHFPHGPQKNQPSEYASRFVPPNEFLYEQGVWKGPPPASTTKADNKASNDDDEGRVSSENSWFSEVMELRNKAAEYKKRARGTHFSRQHVAQLFAQQNELWDTASTSSVLSALSLERTVSERSIPVIPQSHSKKANDKPPAGKRTAWGHDRDPPTPRDNASVISTVSASNTYELESCLSETPTLVESTESVRTASDMAPSADGRLATPVIPDGKRHHLDRTTPLVGGALLSSPGMKKAKGKRQRNKHSARSQASTNSGATSEARIPSSAPAPVARETQTSKRVNSLMQPTYGMPTRDAHFLLDDDASTDRPMNTKYVHSPPQENKGARHNRDKFAGVDVPPTIQEASGATYEAPGDKKSSSKRWGLPASGEVRLSDIPARPQEDDDVLSMSVRSVASSCSLASEVLERAKERQAAFWGQQPRTGKA